MKSLTYRTTPTPVLDLLPSLIAPKTNRPHARATCEAIEFLVDDGSILPAEVMAGFRGALSDTRYFFCEIHAEVDSLVSESSTFEI
jgi:hypothetical protein